MKTFKQMIAEGKEIQKHVDQFVDISGSGQGEFPSEWHEKEFKKHAASIPAKHKSAVLKAIRKEMKDSGEYTRSQEKQISGWYSAK